MEPVFKGYEWRALLTGISIALVQLAFSYLAWHLTHQPGTSLTDAARRYRSSVWRRFLDPALEVIWSLGAPLFALYLGIFSTQDIGIPLPDWQLALPWAGITLAAAAVWIGWLWGRHWFRHPEECPDVVHAEQTNSAAGILAHILSQEGYAASARSALIPLCGPYWGVWAGAAAKILISAILPATRTAYKSAERDLILLDWASDVICGALFIVTRSIIITSGLRLALRLEMLGLARLISRKRQSVDNQREQHQYEEHRSSRYS